MKATWLFLFCSLCPGAPVTYTLLPAGATAPSARFDGAIAHDPVTDQVFLFGGQDTRPQNDLWAYSLVRGQWVEVAARGADRPPARFGHTLLFDSVRRRLILFGGQSSGFFSDVWAFDLAAGAWQQLSRDDSGPKRRYGHSAIYDPARDRMIISHGFTDEGRFDDTWEFDFGRNAWRDLSPSDTRPLRRCLHHAVLDPDRNEMLLYGGCASGFGPCPLGDLWAFDLRTNRWRERTAPAKPPARQHYGIAFDTARRVLVLFGGSGAGFLNDTWEFDPESGAWREATVDGPPPSRRSRHESTFASNRGAALFFGGTTSTGAPTNELWTLSTTDIASAPQISAAGIVNVFSGDGIPVAPGEVVSIYGTRLGPAEALTFAVDPATGLLPSVAAGVSVTWNGIPAPLYYVSASQLNVQVPYELASAREASVVVTVSGRSSAPFAVAVTATRPGLFPRAWNQNGLPNTPANPANAGDVVVLYATGQGVTQPASRTGSVPVDTYPEPAAPTGLTIGGIPAEILFRGQAPGTVGVMQINVRIPAGAPAGSAVPVLLTVGSGESRTTIAIR